MLGFIRPPVLYPPIPPGPVLPPGPSTGNNLLDWVLNPPKKPPWTTTYPPGFPLGGGNNPSTRSSKSVIVGATGTVGAEIYVAFSGVGFQSYGCRENVGYQTGKRKVVYHNWQPGDKFRAVKKFSATGRPGNCPQTNITSYVASLSLVKPDGRTFGIASSISSGYSLTGAAAFDIELVPIGTRLDNPLPEIENPNESEEFPGPIKRPRPATPLPPLVKPKPAVPILPTTPKKQPNKPTPRPEIDPKLPPETPPAKPPAPAKPKPTDPKPADVPAMPPRPGPGPLPRPTPRPDQRPDANETPDAPNKLPQIDKNTGTIAQPKLGPIQTTPQNQHLTKDGPVTGNGPQPNLEDIARELGRQEQKLAKIIDRVTPQQGGPLDIGDLLQILNLIRDLLTNNVSGTIYEVEAACTIKGEDQPRKHTIEVPGGLDKNMAAIARLDAIAELIGAAQLLKQATCGKNTSTPGNNVTVTAYEVIKE